MVLRRPVTLWSWNRNKSISTMQIDQPPPMLQADSRCRHQGLQDDASKREQPQDATAARAGVSVHWFSPWSIRVSWGPHSNAFEKENDAHGTVIIGSGGPS